MYEKAVHIISDYLARELGMAERDRDRVRFGLEMLISTLISLTSSLVLAMVLGLLKPVIFVLISGAVLKMLAGGVHFNTVWECAFTTSIFTNFLAFLASRSGGVIYSNWQVYFVISALYILLSLLIWAPSDVPQKPITERREIRLFKITSIIVAMVILGISYLLIYLFDTRFIIISAALILGLIFQAFAINPLAYRLQGYYYKFIRNNTEIT